MLPRSVEQKVVKTCFKVVLPNIVEDKGWKKNSGSL